MKIGTLTTHMADNYGAVLQAYALSAYLREKNTDCEIVNYYPDYLRDAYHRKPRISSVKSAINAVYAIAYGCKRRERSRRFEVFRDKYMCMSPRYKTYDELAAASANYDAIIAGSDQIWNPDIHHFDESFFLTFCKDGVKKYGYAPSFGISTLTEDQVQEIRRRCQGFASLAFREESGVRIAKDILQRDCPLVLDPVFLLPGDDWKKFVSADKPKEAYVLCYFLSDPRNSVKAMCKRFRKQGIRVISIGFSVRDRINSAKKMYDLGPLDFLSYIYHAECILTDSFHATAFSILFGKNFYTRVDGVNAKRADRIVSLLKLAGLENRTYADKNAGDLMFETIDYDKVNVQISSAIDKSRFYADSIVEDISR